MDGWETDSARPLLDRLAGLEPVIAPEIIR